jgi:hypothetical protein
MSGRPSPPQPESKFPPPQQSVEEEKRMSNRPGEPELLHTEPAVFLAGAPFPEKSDYDPNFQAPRRTLYVSAEAKSPGDGSLERPWMDLQDALCRLEPGDRLVLAAAIYAGSFRVAGPCRSGTADAPIQVFARHAFLKAAGLGDVLTIERAHWQFWEVQIALLDSDAAGFVAVGPEAHHIAIDQSHIYEGKGPAVRLGPDVSDVVISNCHIHQSNGIRIEAGTKRITLVNNHIHHNRSASVTIGGGAAAAPAREITVVGNRIHNDRGPALDLSHCDGVTVSRNRLSNYRPDEENEFSGEAIRMRSGCRNVSFENNSVIEASTAIRLEQGPEHIFLRRNYFENQLTKESTAVRIEQGRDIRFQNNVVNRYAEPFRIAASGVSDVSIANNLVLQPSVGWTLGTMNAINFFDYNVFGAQPSLQASIGTNSVAVADWMRRHMPHSQIVPDAGIADRDLSRLVGFSPVDAGKMLEGLNFRGSSPDIGVAEH